MAKNITLMGASYSNVPAVQLPQTGGGTARFDDASVTTATASDVASGKVFLAADGTITTGTNSGGGGVINNGSDVFFIDYDGSIVASYSKSNLVMPSNPSHTGLTSQGWNWTQQQIINQLTAYPNQPVYVGQMYITDDGKTRIYVHFEEGRTSPYLGLGVKGTVTIDWGDNTTDTLTGTSLNGAVNIQHIYQAGDYVITLTPTSGSFSIFGTSNGTHLLKKETTVNAFSSRVYSNAVQKVELGSGVSIGSYAFDGCSSLVSVTIPSNVTSIGSYAFDGCSSLVSVTIPSNVTSIGAYAFDGCSSLVSVTIPSSVTSIGTYIFYDCYSLVSVTIPSSVTSISNYMFYDCYSLVSVTIPSNVTSISTYAFRNCYALASVTIPSNVTSISGNAFRNCYALASVTIPSNVTSIGAYAFYNCYGMAEYHFLRTTPPTLSNVNAFTGIQSDCVIYVPYSADHSVLNAYKTASNWSTYASYMQEEPQ